MLSEGTGAMTPEQLCRAARNLAYGLGITVYIRDGKIYQFGPGLAFLPPNGDPEVAEVPRDNGSLTLPKAIGLFLMGTSMLWLAQQMLAF
jgi:hypothetical protein